MNAQPSFHGRIYRALLLILLLPAVSPAQLISLKTAPIAAGNQFLVFPSQNLAMGGVSIALEDPFLDPFINPAKGARISGVHLFGAPLFYNISDNQGSARTLPLGALCGIENWFGGLSIAVQQMQAAESQFQPIILPQPGQESLFYWPGLQQQNANNVYIAGLLGTRLPGSNISLGAGLYWAGLEALDGVDLLYPRSQKIEQFGHMADFRLGIFAEFPNRHTLEALVLFNNFDMTHEVSYIDRIWDSLEDHFFTAMRIERNLDRTDTWGAHLGYTLPVPGEEWRIGGLFTANWKTHPKIPNYELMNIPRDPGDSQAFNLGVGVSSMVDSIAVFGADLIFEPVWSHTWAEAAGPLQSRSGKIIFPGEKTVDNHFKFSNWKLRIGIGQQGETFGFRLGMQVRWFHYRLNQYDCVNESARKQKEHWYEWAPALGLHWNFPNFKIHYNGQLTLGTGRPGIAGGVMTDSNRIAAMSGDFLIAPSGRLALDGAILLTHQVSVIFPIRD
jgi:hypothetical protein